jgi:hypothetical protein
MLRRLDAWDRFHTPSFWWMHAMVITWAIFTMMLFVAKPLLLNCVLSCRGHAGSHPAGALSGQPPEIVAAYQPMVAMAVAETQPAELPTFGVLLYTPYVHVHPTQ